MRLRTGGRAWIPEEDDHDDDKLRLFLFSLGTNHELLVDGEEEEEGEARVVVVGARGVGPAFGGGVVRLVPEIGGDEEDRVVVVVGGGVIVTTELVVVVDDDDDKKIHAGSRCCSVEGGGPAVGGGKGTKVRGRSAAEG